MMNPGGREQKVREEKKAFAFQWSSGSWSAAAPGCNWSPQGFTLIVVTALVPALMEEMEPVETQAAAVTPRDEATAGRDWRGT